MKNAVPEEVPGGFGFRMPAARLLDVARWVSLESRCCPFLKFTIEMGPGAGELKLALAGGEGVKEFLRSQFGGKLRN